MKSFYPRLVESEDVDPFYMKMDWQFSETDFTSYI